MKIIIQDFELHGEHIDEATLEMPNVNSFDQIPEGRLESYIRESIEQFAE